MSGSERLIDYWRASKRLSHQSASEFRHTHRTDRCRPVGGRQQSRKVVERLHRYIQVLKYAAVARRDVRIVREFIAKPPKHAANIAELFGDAGKHVVSLDTNLWQLALF